MADFILAGVDDKVLITVCLGAVIFFVAGYLTLKRFQSMANRRNNDARTQNHQSYDSEACPICLETYRLTVETNCGHKFCGPCITNYLNRTTGDFSLFSGRKSCPLCRQRINILLTNFSPEDAVLADLQEERVRVERIVHEYNVRFGQGPRDAWSYVTDCPVLLRHLFFDFFTFGGLVWMFKLKVILLCVGVFVYLFNPFDFIPETIFGVFGFLDDVLVFLLCVIYVSIIYRRVVINRGTNAT